MIKVDLWGRMGNQMFQYAFATETARRFKTFFTIIPSEKFELVTYFELDFFTRLCYHKFLFKAYRFVIIRTFLFKNIRQVNHRSLDVKNNIRYKGFFQSENFFINSKDKICKNFEIKKNWKEKYLKEYRLHFKDSDKIIALHFRRTDYVNAGGDHVGGTNLCLPMTYYDNCLSLIKNIEEYKIICISDDIEYVKEHYKERNNFFFLSNEAIIDFQFILNSNIAILANSTFSWWAGYLGSSKKVFAPKYWSGFKIDLDYPYSIIPSKWESINVY
jgi:hypothetical protein